MGNCFSLKHKKKDVTRDHPVVSKWLASCDFSSIPDLEECSVEGAAQNCVVYDSVLGGEHVGGDCDGYTTAVENLESEDDASGDGSGVNAPSSSGTQHQRNSSTFLDEESIYETSDEQVPNDPGDVPETPMFSARVTQNAEEAEAWREEDEECDVIEDLSEWRNNYDARPICPLPTPLRKNLISPRVDLEALVDRKGRVRRTGRVKLYLDEKRQAAK